MVKNITTDALENAGLNFCFLQGQLGIRLEDREGVEGVHSGRSAEREGQECRAATGQPKAQSPAVCEWQFRG